VISKLAVSSFGMRPLQEIFPQLIIEEEDGTFWDTLGHLPTQPATNPSPKLRKQPKTSLLKNFAPSLLLLLHSFQKIQIESTSI
jgi:hypothetical protein